MCVIKFTPKILSRLKKTIFSYRLTHEWNLSQIIKTAKAVILKMKLRLVNFSTYWKLNVENKSCCENNDTKIKLKCKKNPLFWKGKKL